MANINSMEYWMEQLASRSPTTRHHYKLYLLKFAEWLNKTPNELIEMQKAAQKRSEDPRENRVLEGKLNAFISLLEERGKSISTQQLAYAGVTSFFKCNLFPLDMSPQDRPTGEAKGSRIPEKEEIMKMLNAAKSQTYRAAVLLLKDSGLRVSDAVKLRWRDIEDFGEGFWGWKIVTKKRKVVAAPFVGPEATAALKLLERKRERIFPIKPAALSNAIYYIISRTDLRDVSAHGLRKFFNVELQAARVPREWRYQMMGKKTGAYDENRMRKLFEAYREAYDHLRVYGAGVNVEVEKLKKSMEELREENRRLRARVNGMRSEKMSLAEDIDRLTRTLEGLAEEVNKLKKK